LRYYVCCENRPPRLFVRPPEGLYYPEGCVLRLRKSLYGLKQSGREWYIEACKGLGELGFQPIFSEPSIFATADRRLLIGLYVDDMLILGKDSTDIDRVVKGIGKRWKIKDLGEVSMILGIRVTRDRKEGSSDLPGPGRLYRRDHQTLPT
jgi:hypothetical protein